jgi:DNA-binding transcriptional LysR family regulator
MQGARMDWDDLRYFLAVARSGSTIAAARGIGVNQTTVARRIAELERVVGTRLFERHREGYRLRADGEALRQAAEQAEAGVQAFTAQAGALGRGVGRLRVTTNEPLANVILAPAIQAFRTERPDVHIDLVISPRRLDLAAGEADIALRAAPEPGGPNLIARRVGDANWGAYCSEDYARRHGAPAGLDDLGGHTILVIDDPSGRRLERLSRPAAVRFGETLNDLCVEVRAGLGVASLPCVLGDSLAGFVRCFVQPEPVTPLWIAYHERLRGAPEVRAFVDAVAAAAHAARDSLHGRDAP